MVLTKIIDEYQGKPEREAWEAITLIEDTMKLCGHQNILMRGHRDSTKK